VLDVGVRVQGGLPRELPRLARLTLDRQAVLEPPFAKAKARDPGSLDEERAGI
jgi:hypothetical protein